MNDLKAEILGYIDAHSQDLAELLREMIVTKSVNPAFDPESAGEGGMARLVTSRYDRLGIPCETYEGAPRRPNVVATLAGTGDGPHLLVNCHMDTHNESVGEWVDPFTGETVHEWTADPFGGEIRDGKMYGRGTADHKSPIAAMLMALEALKASGVRLKGTVTCIHDVDEETGGRFGMRHLMEVIPFDFDMALYACTSEFTPLGREFFPVMGTDNIIRSFSGWQTYRIRVVGQNLHTLTPKRGYGAVEAALLLLERLQPLIEAANAYVDPIEGTGQPPMRVSAIDCAPRAAYHHQAGWCEVVLNRRVPATVDPQQAKREIYDVIERFNHDFPDNEATAEVVREIAPAVTAADSPLVTGLQSAVKDALGREASVVGLASSVGISATLDRLKIPTVLFGYGYVNLHHAIDEHIELKALVKTAKVYALALMEWLGVEGRD